VDVLAAIGHPVRLAIVHALASGEETFCGAILPNVPKSSLTHHWRALRESGVIRQRPSGRKLYLTLRVRTSMAASPACSTSFSLITRPLRLPQPPRL
jgi:DNA-binding transcriptional ArsR family regulator